MNVPVPTLSKLPNLPLSSKFNLPPIPGIYFVLDGESVLYIGKSENIRQRWTVYHHRSHQISERYPDARIAWMEVSDLNVLFQVESFLINHFDPLLNRSEVPSRNGKKLRTFQMSDNQFLRLRKAAKLNDMTLTRQMEVVLESYFSQYEQEHGVALDEIEIPDEVKPLKENDISINEECDDDAFDFQLLKLQIQDFALSGTSWTNSTPEILELFAIASQRRHAYRKHFGLRITESTTPVSFFNLFCLHRLNLSIKKRRIGGKRKQIMHYWVDTSELQSYDSPSP